MSGTRAATATSTPLSDLRLSDTEIRAAVGAGAFNRARAYVAVGAVTSLTVEPGPRQGAVVTADVQGTDVEPYEVDVALHRQRGGRLALDGECSCPVGWNCKHVAAVLLVALAAGRPAPGPVLREVPRQPAWAQALRPMVAGTPAAPAGPCVALQFEVVDAGGRGKAVTLRPVVPGAKAAWIRTGISWPTLTHHHLRRRAPEAVRLLEEIWLLSNPVSQWVIAPGGTVSLDTFPSRRIWPILGDAARAGLPLVCAGAAAEPVALSAEPARAGVDLTAGGDGWRMRGVLTCGAAELPRGSYLLLGRPAHGVAWFAPGRALRLAPFEAPLDPDVHELLARRDELAVPSADVPWFLGDFYPALRRRVEFASSDGSVQLPAPAPPRLLARAAYEAAGRVEVSWAWRYAIGTAVREVALGAVAAGPAFPRDPDRDPEAEAKLLAAAATCADALPALLTADGSGLRPHARLSGADALVGLAAVLAGLREVDGVDVEVAGAPPDLRRASGALDVVLAGAGATGSGAAGNDWLDLDLVVTLDGEPVPFVTLFGALAAGERHLLLPSGVYTELDHPHLERLRAAIDEARAMTEPGRATLRLSRFQAGLADDLRRSARVQGDVADWFAGTGWWGRDDPAGLGSTADVEVPASLRAQLRPYQRAGFAWLAFLYSHRLGGVLADDMGLGKTLQAIALFCRVREDEAAAGTPGVPFLVVAPTSVVPNWAAELRRFAPHLRVATVAETEARRGAPLADVAAGVDVLVTSYALLRLEHDHYVRLPWAALVLDEAQAVKNHATKGNKCVRSLPAPVKIAITGTPMENNLMELWATFAVVAPGLLGDAKRFAEFYRRPVEAQGDPEKLALLRARIAPLLLRRRKQEVAAELPDKVEQVVSLELEPRHRRVYDSLLARERQKVLGMLDDLDANRVAILRSLTVLRQAAIDPSLVDPAYGGVPATKLDELIARLDEVVAEGHRVLVFSQFTRVLARVRERLDARGVPYCYLDGSTRDRAAVVDAFAAGEAEVFLLSIKAGGVGLNLTQADYCILLDPWWNPATEAQAVDRAHRIGQTRTVMVYRLVAAGTIEDKVMALKERKGRLVGSVLDEGTGGSVALTAEDIRALLGG